MHYTVILRSTQPKEDIRKKWQRSGKNGLGFQTTAQRLADQGWTIIKKGWFSDLEILEIHQKINNQHDTNTVTEISIINKQRQTNRNEPTTSENGNTTQLNNAQPEQTLSRERKLNLENLKKIMNSENTTSA